METFAGLESRDDWTTGPPKAQWPIATSLWKASRLGLVPWGGNPHRGSHCATPQGNRRRRPREQTRGLPGHRPIRRLRRADTTAATETLTFPLPPPFCVFFSLWGPVGGGLARTHGAFPRGANILSSRPKTPEGHMYSCASVGDASGWPFINRGLARAHDEALVHLSALCCTAQVDTTTSDAPARPHLSMLVAACRGRVDAALRQPKLDLPYKRMHPNLEGPARVGGVSSSPTTWQLAARATATAAGGCSRAEQESEQLSISLSLQRWSHLSGHPSPSLSHL